MWFERNVGKVISSHHTPSYTEEIACGHHSVTQEDEINCPPSGRKSKPFTVHWSTEAFILLVEGKVNLLLYTGVRKPLLCVFVRTFWVSVLGMQFRSAQIEFGGEIEFGMKLELSGIEWRRRGDDPIAEA
jgi:hypothetical protein